ncbi:hypothetical protein FG386_000624 [Cryptosporidium ryanae]|uniref:uncharacterized protein n=1 Tax=Cryptosporidium ryanae TaxID=515981 RepID=UPI003519E095|nr:hypothetical protein FG386_000624 [Cryptosporidium ryanae]
MKNGDYKLVCLWLIREYLGDLELSKAVKYINKSYPELESIDNKVIKQYKKIPSIEHLIKHYSEDRNLKFSVTKNKQENKSASIEKVNVNKNEKKRTHKQEKKEQENCIETNKKNKTYNLGECKGDGENTVIDVNVDNDESQYVSASIQHRFKRIDENKYKDKLSDNRLSDNSYWNMRKYSSHSDDFASKAAFELGQVRGKGFRQEKAKKKRCSWKGNGTISTGVSSIQFSDSD